MPSLFQLSSCCLSLEDHLETGGTAQGPGPAHSVRAHLPWSVLSQDLGVLFRWPLTEHALCSRAWLLCAAGSVWGSIQWPALQWMRWQRWMSITSGEPRMRSVLEFLGNKEEGCGRVLVHLKTEHLKYLYKWFPKFSSWLEDGSTVVPV